MNGLAWERGDAPRTAPPRSRIASAVRTALSAAFAGIAVIALAALLAMLTLLVAIRHGPDGETSIFGHPLLAVATGSMSPTFNPGDLILDSPVSATVSRQLRKGEVVTFQSPVYTLHGQPILITHRIQAVIRSSSGGLVGYRTKGDANNVSDPGVVEPGAIVGLYQGWRIPDGAYALNALHRPAAFVVLAVVLVIVLGAAPFRRRWRALAPPPAAATPGAWGQGPR